MRRAHFPRKAATGLAVGGLLIALAASSASAADNSRSLEAMKTSAHAAVHERVTALDQAIAVVSRSDFMGADKAQRTGAMTDAVRGLQALDATIQADTTPEQVKTDGRKIFTDFRVFALVLPVTHEVRAAGAATNVALPKLNEAAARLQEAITKRGAADLQPLLNDMKAKTAEASSLATPVPSGLEGLHAADWNANHDVLKPSRDTLAKVRADLKAAGQDGRKIVAGLKATR